MEVLDKRGEQIQQQQQKGIAVHSQVVSPTVDSRGQDKVYYFPQRTDDGGDKEILERINTIDTSILSTNSETSSVSNSLRGGHKRLKLIRKNMKSKGGEGGGSQNGSISSNFA